MAEQSPVPASHPMMIAWEAYSSGPEYANSAQWAVRPEHTKGSMWAAFVAGWSAASRVSSPQPRSDKEGEDSVECSTCEGSGKIVEPARTEGINQHSACQRDCDDCDGIGRTPTNQQEER